MNKHEDFVIGVEIYVQDTKGYEISLLDSQALSDETMQMIIEDVAEYLQGDE